VLTRCSVPPQLLVLGARQGLPPLGPMDVVVARSRAARGHPAVEAMHRAVVEQLARPG